MARLGQRPIIVRAARAAQRAAHEQDRQQREPGEWQNESGLHGGPFLMRCAILQEKGAPGLSENAPLRRERGRARRLLTSVNQGNPLRSKRLDGPLSRREGFANQAVNQDWEAPHRATYRTARLADVRPSHLLISAANI